jgi:hypothetical protein
VIGVELSQSEVGLHDVEGVARAVPGFLRRKSSAPL